LDDLGVSPEEAENLRVRSDLMIELTRLMEAGGGVFKKA
jgi:predicted XRE-type DNA-binding protein